MIYLTFASFLNMRYFKFILIHLCLATTLGYSQQKEMQLPDYYGEHINYDLNVGFFTIGEVDLDFRGDSIGCDAYVSCFARSTGLVSFVKDVRYDFDACVDTSLGYTTQSKRIVTEGDFYDYDEVFYDRITRQDSAIAVTEDFDTLIIPNDVYDILMAFFQFRKNFIAPNMEVGSIVSLKTFFVDKEWDLNIKYGGKEEVRTDLGTAMCYKFHPQTEVGKYFSTTDDMTMWVTANRHRIPVRFRVELNVATLVIDIQSYTKVQE